MIYTENGTVKGKTPGVNSSSDMDTNATQMAKDYLDDVLGMAEAKKRTSESLSAGLQMVANKLQENLRRLECRETVRRSFNTTMKNHKRTEGLPGVQKNDEPNSCVHRTSSNCRERPPMASLKRIEKENYSVVAKSTNATPRSWR